MKTKQQLTPEQMEADWQARTIKGQIACKEAEIMRLCEEYGLDKSNFIEQSYSGDSTAIDDLFPETRGLFTRMSRRRDIKILLRELNYLTWRSVRPHELSDQEFTIRVSSLVRTFTRLYPHFIR
jgi:hypothetical protein